MNYEAHSTSKTARKNFSEILYKSLLKGYSTEYSLDAQWLESKGTQKISKTKTSLSVKPKI